MPQTHEYDCLVLAKWLIPIEPAAVVLENYGLVVDGDRIAMVAPRQELLKHSYRRVVELPDSAILPGLINAHGHAAMSLFRGMADDLPLQAWLQKHIWPAEAQWVSEDFVAAGADLAIAEQLLAGITCFADMYFHPQTLCARVHHSGIRAQVFMPIVDASIPGARTVDDAISQALELHDDFRHHPRIPPGFGPHAPYTVSDASLNKLLTLINQLDAAVQMHVHETAREVEDSMRQYGMRPLARLAELDLLGPRFQAVHMTSVNSQDIELLLQNNCSVVHCPNSNLKLASGFCPVERLRHAGINVALGTDGAASNNSLGLLEEARSAALLAKAIAQDAGALNAHQTLRMATLNGARAMGMQDQIGSLVAGKLADFISINLGELTTQPVYDAASAIVYAAGSSQVEHVWVGGKQLVESRQLLHMDAEQVGATARQWQQRISKKPPELAS